ncbi:hypothetical protein CWD78_09450 [Dickeya dadantii]|nr:hypothetical protein [Dickeya dadantii]
MKKILAIITLSMSLQAHASITLTPIDSSNLLLQLSIVYKIIVMKKALQCSGNIFLKTSHVNPDISLIINPAGK